MRFPDLKRVSYPASITEAVQILSDQQRKAVPIGGGVSFVFAPLPAVEELVSLNRLDLDYIRMKGGGLQIGATTLISGLVESRSVKSYADGMLWEAARRIGSSLNRNLITVGGNLIQPFIWTDLSTVALALGARIKIHGRSSRAVTAEGFFSKPPGQILEKGELVTEFFFPSLPPGSRAAYHKFTLTENDFGILKVAIVLLRRKRFCRDITIAVGGGRVLPQRMRDAEAVLRGRDASQYLVNETSIVAAEGLKLTRDIRCSEDYKREVCRAIVRGILEEIMLDQKVPEWRLI